MRLAPDSNPSADAASGQATGAEGAIPPDCWYSGYSPAYLTHITKVYDDGTVDIRAVVYLPDSAESPSGESISRSSPSAVEVRVNGDRVWQPLQPSPSEKDYWSLDLARVAEGSRLSFRYREREGDWRPISPLGNVESYYGAIYVPSLKHVWQHPVPTFDRGKVLLETTLEGLLAGYKGGKFMANSKEELLHDPIAERILRTDIPGQLAARGVDQIMVPICSSVADRAHLNPKFNYLTYNFADIDWQIGSPSAFKQLVDTFYAHGIQIVPDLIFAHQVRTPFEGSMDLVGAGGEASPFVDREAFLFRDYGTWMLNLSVPEIRRMLIEKLVTFITRYHLKIVRVDYIDGLVLQYSNRPQNHGESLVRELRAELRRVCPEVRVLGETFEMAGNPVVKDSIDIFYTPVGFTILEELYRPPDQLLDPQRPNLDAIAHHIKTMLGSSRREAYYAQLHDETWCDPHVKRGRPHVPWAYGGNPAQLAKAHGEALVEMGAFGRDRLLDYVRRTVRAAEALTMFLADYLYMYVPGVDSLSLDALDGEGEWVVSWEGVPRSHRRAWVETGLSSREVFRLHERHRAEMTALRQLFQRYTKVNEATSEPQVTPYLHHANAEASVLSVLRYSHHHLEDSLLIAFNFGPTPFGADAPYELPVPQGFERSWRVLFDGDAPEPTAYPSGTELRPASGQYSNQDNVLRLQIGARSLVVLKYQ